MNDHELAVFLADSAGKRMLDLRANAEYDVRDLSARQAFEKVADNAANDFLLAQLAALRPDDAVLSEESLDDPARLASQRVWIIDPIDGSREFAKSEPEFAIHVALWESGRLIAGAVAIPNADVVWSTNDEVSDQSVQNLARPIVIVASNREPERNIEILEKRLQNFAQKQGFAGVAVMHCGSVGGKVHQILAGVGDVYVSSVGFNEWDSAAPTVVAQHHGLVVTDFDGNELTFNCMPPRTPSFVVARTWLHQQVLRAVADF